MSRVASLLAAAPARSALRLLPAAALLAGAVLSPREALGNGRFPAANHISLRPGDAKTVFARTTFGLLLSHDGATFEWMCEQLAGYGGSQDPAVQLLHDGSLAVALFDGLSVSADGGCSFPRKPELEGQFVIDLALDPQIEGSAVALTSSGLDENKFYVQVFETKDSGKTWSKAGVPAPDDLLAETLEAAPSRPERLYVSGFYTAKVDGKATRKGAIEVSDDRGASWSRTEVDLAGDLSLYIAGIDPKDPDRVYARTRSGANDRLLVSSDGGKSFSQALQIDGSMLGFAVSPDGSTVAVGGPTAGLLTAPRESLAFEKKADKQVSCLAWGAGGLYACGSGYKDGYVIGVSGDGGASFTPVLQALGAVAGPVSSCPASAPLHATCDSTWSTLEQQFGDAAGGAAGAAGAAGEAGAAGSTGAGATGGAGASTTPAGPTGDGGSSSGCSCRTAPGVASIAGPGLWLVAISSLLSRFRNRSPSQMKRPPARGARNSAGSR